uniref:ATP synthase F0 subunit 8 n=1 Tax=Ylodes simulans TaxID=2719101 RepID=A0A7D7AG65_9NEOP|nr:ATP synthase F0 subunit 8 [Ylodes simulans]
MPQMMPLNWLMLYLMFIIIFLLFIMIIYYLFSPSIPHKLSYKQKSLILNWKW